MKKCSKCKEEKELIEFGKNKQNKDGLSGQCKLCVSKYYKEYCLNNKEKIINNKKEYRLNNKEYFKEKSKQYRLNNKEYYKEYRLNNKEHRNKYIKNKKLIEPLFKLTINTRSLIGQSFRRSGYSKNSKTYQILECSFEDFKTYLESQFTSGMTWDNQGEWHLDHIYPISLAKTEDELIRLNHYTNFQPLWAVDNIKKGNKIIEKQLTLI